jgi:hypothetical protein
MKTMFSYEHAKESRSVLVKVFYLFNLYFFGVNKECFEIENGFIEVSIRFLRRFLMKKKLKNDFVNPSI